MTEAQAKVSNWNVPNALTALRIVMVPFYGWALLVDGGDSITWRVVAAGIFGYSDEDGTEAENLDGKLDADTIAERVQRIGNLVEELTSQRAEDRVGSEVVVLIEQEEDDENDCVGRAEHQAPEVDGECIVLEAEGLKRGEFVRCRVVDSEGVDLIVEVIPT